jgi:hypothetical protein
MNQARFRQGIRKYNKLEIIVLVFSVLGSLLFRLTSWEKMTFWNVDESLTFWYLKNVVIDRKLSLIGLHFFSLEHGAVYRTALFNWVMAIPMTLFGFKVKVLVYAYAALAVLSMICVARIAHRLGGRAAFLAALFLYAFSWYIRIQEMKLWYAALMITVSAVAVWWLFRSEKNWTLRRGLILGMIVGFGFSLHFVVLWLAAGIIIYWLIADRIAFMRKLTGFVIGLVVMVAPLILFNLRHNFIMLRGFVNMMTGAAVEDQATIAQRWSVASQELTCVIGKVEAMGCSVMLPLVLLIVAVAVAGYSAPLKTKRFFVYVSVQLVIGFIGLFYAGRLSYSSQHYVFYVIPLIVLVLSLGLARLARTPVWAICFFLMIAYLGKSTIEQNNYDAGDSYAFKRDLAEYIYSLPASGSIAIQFWDQETLAYDFVFYETALKLGIPYDKVNLIERWGVGKPDGYVFLNEGPGIPGTVYHFGRNKLLLSNDKKEE